VKLARSPRYPVQPPRVVEDPNDLLTEAQWQRTVVEALKLYGWRVFHDRVAWRSDPGWPDLTCVHIERKRVIFVELKSERGRLTPKQEYWRDTLVHAGQDWHLWRPSDWDAAQRVMRGERP
jgi:hypothetical protein